MINKLNSTNFIEITSTGNSVILISDNGCGVCKKALLNFNIAISTIKDFKEFNFYKYDLYNHLNRRFIVNNYSPFTKPSIFLYVDGKLVSKEIAPRTKKLMIDRLENILS